MVRIGLSDNVARGYGAMEQTVTLDQLEAFAQVARTRGFSRAAVALGLAQPTLSERVAALERELDVRLFVRHGHSVELSEAGQALLPYAERMLALRLEGAERARESQRGALGKLALGANPSCSQYLAPRLLMEFWGQHHQVRVSVRTALTPALMGDLQDGAIQLALGSRPQMHPRADILWTYTDELLLVGAPSHPLARRGTCLRADLVGQTLLSSHAGPSQQGLQQLLRDPATELALEATAGELIKRMVTAGAGLTVLPRLAVWEELAAGALVPILVLDARLPPYEVALARWPGRALTPAAEALRLHLRGVRVPALLGPSRV